MKNKGTSISSSVVRGHDPCHSQYHQYNNKDADKDAKTTSFSLDSAALKNGLRFKSIISSDSFKKKKIILCGIPSIKKLIQLK